MRWLALQHLINQVIEHKVMAARKTVDAVYEIAVTKHGESRHL